MKVLKPTTNQDHFLVVIPGPGFEVMAPGGSNENRLFLFDRVYCVGAASSTWHLLGAVLSQVSYLKGAVNENCGDCEV